MSYTNTISSSIPEFIEQNLNLFNQFNEKEWEFKSSADKWSRKEMLGHLCDSAMTNIRRLIVSQHKQNEKIIYNQNEWVQYSDYQNMPVDELIQLWRLLNRQYHRISQTIPPSSLDNTCDTSDIGISLKTLRFLIDDYWGHQEHHLKQILR